MFSKPRLIFYQVGCSGERYCMIEISNRSGLYIMHPLTMLAGVMFINYCTLNSFSAG